MGMTHTYSKETRAGHIQMLNSDILKMQDRCRGRGASERGSELTMKETLPVMESEVLSLALCQT